MSNFMRQIRKNAGMAAPRPAPAPQQRQINLDANDTIEKRCECGGELFDLVYRYRVLPSVSAKNPTGKDMPIKIEALVCIACGVELGKKAQ